MDAAVYTLDRLRGLEQLYRRGFHSAVIDRTVDKLLATEIEQAKAEQQDLEIRLSAYEKKHIGGGYGRDGTSGDLPQGCRGGRWWYN